MFNWWKSILDEQEHGSAPDYYDSTSLVKMIEHLAGLLGVKEENLEEFLNEEWEKHH